MAVLRSRFLLFALFCLTIAAPARADKRVALVIGNSAYKSIKPLDNPKNDAALMAVTLRGLGFTLVGGGAQLDLDKVAIDHAAQKFGDELLGADVGLFYYAGHGLQVRGANYLVPIDANPTREADLDFQMLDANLVLRQMEDAGTKLNLVILDACRNNPFGGRGLRAVEAGLAIMKAPEGTLISFATQPGNVARDGTDGDSPYTKALAQTMRKPGLDVFRMFNEVGLAVSSATAGMQQPWVSHSPIKGDFYFVGALGSAAVSPVAAGPGEAERAWDFVKDTTSQAVLEEFIRRYGDSFHAILARDKLQDLMKKAQVATAPPVALLSPPSAPSPNDPADPTMETIRAFYAALGSADGNRAASLVVPEKRKSGALSASAISKFYSSLTKPLQLNGLMSLGGGKYQADYSYGAGTHTCRGSAVVTTAQLDGRTYVQSIKAPTDSCS
jgi:hypothetical protein